MHIMNRTADITKLRCLACQDFLKMIVVEGWKELWYEVVNSYMQKKQFTSIYRPAYDEMRNHGIDKYSIEKMDVTLITNLILHNERLFKIHIKKEIKEALGKLNKARQETSHLDGHETDDELYRKAESDCEDIQLFVVTVDEYATDIPVDERSKFRISYYEQAEELRKIIWDERYQNIQRYKEYDEYIQDVLNEKDERKAERKWTSANDRYLANVRRKKNWDETNDFYRRASDKGVRYAHKWAAGVDFSEGKYSEGCFRVEKLWDTVLMGFAINLDIEPKGDFLVAINELNDRLKTKGARVRWEKNRGMGYRLFCEGCDS